MNIVATARTRRVANDMIREALGSNGADAVLTHLAHLPAEQIPALIAVVLDSSAPRPRRKELTLNLTDRLRGYSQYNQGIRTPFAITAYREYQRAHKRGERHRGIGRARARMSAEEEQYTHEDARRARSAYLAGDRTEWAVTGQRVYYRRAKRGSYRTTSAAS